MLDRMWSPTGLFEDVKFHPGINLIIGRYAPGRRLEDSGINGIGKSSIVRTLDYLLLADAKRHAFAHSKYAWLGEQEHRACLSLTVGGTRVVIERAFNKSGVDEVVLQIGEGPRASIAIRDARVLLGDIFFPPRPGSIGADGRFRSLLPFYVKDDLNAHKRYDPVKFMTHGGGNLREATIFSLYLLGLPNEGLVKLESARTSCDVERRGRDHLKQRIEEETGKTLDVLRTEMVNAASRLAEITKAVRDFNLFSGFEEVAAALSKIEADASAQRKTATQAARQLEKLRRFVRSTEEIDADSVTRQYLDISSTLGAAVKKSLDEVLEFRKSMAQQRLRFHGKRLVELDQVHVEAMRKLADLELSRSMLMKTVDTTNFHETFDSAIQRLATEHGDLERYRAALGQIKISDARISEFELQMQVYRHEASAALNEVESELNLIRARYIDVVQNAVTTSADESTGAALDIATQSGTAGKSLPVKISVSLPKLDALAMARMILVAYDLTVLLHQVEEELAVPRFLVHDGVFHGIARRITVKTLNYIAKQAELANADGRDFQYIATFNVDELSSAAEDQVRDGGYEFDLDSVTTVRLSDTQGERFFKREF